MSDTQIKLDNALAEYRLGNYTNLRKFAKEHDIPLEKLVNHLRNNRAFADGRTKYIFDESYFFKIDDEIKAYWLGFMVADGHVSKNRIIIQLSAKDRDLLKKFADLFSIPLTEINRKMPDSGGIQSTVRIQLNSKRMADDLCNKGLTPRKTYDLDLTVFKHIPKRLMHHFIKGIFDGDGSIDATGPGRYRFLICGYREIFLSKIRDILEVEIGVGRVQISKGGTIPILGYGGRLAILRIKEYLYKDATIFLERKKARLDSIPCNKKYNGVYFNNQNPNQKWRAILIYNHKQHYLGSYTTATLAAKAYDIGVDKYGLPKYKKNFPNI